MWLMKWKDTIEGEHKDKQRAGSIQIDSLQWHCYRPVGGDQTGVTRGRSTAKYGNFEVGGPMDASFAKMLEVFQKGDTKDCVIEGVADFGGSRGTYLKFELEKVSIVSIEFHGIGDDTIPDTYSVSLNYEKCTPTYTKRKKDGGSDGDVPGPVIVPEEGEE
jgi:type VI protein secretion system component Hcp